jgi:hypothetical protein
VSLGPLCPKLCPLLATCVMVRGKDLAMVINGNVKFKGFECEMFVRMSLTSDVWLSWMACDWTTSLFPDTPKVDETKPMALLN